jgi:hypothetical protein
MKIGVFVLCVIFWTIICVIIGIIWGYEMGQKDTNMEWLEKEDYYYWLLEMKKKEELLK